MSDASNMFNATVRAEQIIYVPGAVAVAEETPGAFREFCEDLPGRADAPLYLQLPVLAKYAETDDWPKPEDVAFDLLYTPGFLVQGATPVRDYSSDPEDQSFLSSWGYFHTAWLYAASEADISRVIMEWADALHVAKRRAALAKAEAAA